MFRVKSSSMVMLLLLLVLVVAPTNVMAESAVASSTTTLTSKAASILLGIIMAFNSGFINGCCLSGFMTTDGAAQQSQAVAAVTASWTNSATGIAGGNMGKFYFLGSIILSFMTGSAIAGFLNSKPRSGPFSIGHMSDSTSAFMVAAILLIGAVQMFQMENDEIFSSFSAARIGFMLTAMANGVQNSITSTLTANLCRSSHYTGITSDMGTFLGQILAGNTANLFKLQVFAGLSLSFWMGGFLSLTPAKTYGPLCLYGSSALYVIIGSTYSQIAAATMADKPKKA